MIRKKFKQISTVCIILTLILLVGCQSSKSSESNLESETTDLSQYENSQYFISADKLNEMLGDESLVLLDCNKPDIYAKSHLPGAIGIGLHAFSDKIGKPGDEGWGTIKSKEDLEKELTLLGIDETKTVVLYSDVFNGPGADGRAAWQLSLAGFENAKILMGGSSYWSELGYETTSEETPLPVASSGITLNEYDQSYIATKDEVFNSLGKTVLLDVRSKKEFDGSQSAGEPRGGHITGAGHILWTDFLEKNGTLKSPEDIEAIMASFNVNKSDDLTLY